MIRPITPKQARETPRDIPDFVIEIVNEHLKGFDGGMITIRQNKLVEEIVERMSTMTAPPLDPDECRRTVFENRYLDFETHFIKAGWKVTFDKPGFNETYESTWEFSAKR